jgi:hypothetical protein
VTGVAARPPYRTYARERMDVARILLVLRARIARAALCASLLIGLYFMPLTGHAQEIYKSVDADGHVVYSDRGANKTAPKTSIHVEQPDAANAARLAKEQQLLDAEEQQRRAQQVLDDKSKAQQEVKARQRQQRCQDAKDHYYAMKDANRLYTRDADGNRVYYSDEESDKKRDEARRAMEAACAN